MGLWKVRSATEAPDVDDAIYLRFGHLTGRRKQGGYSDWKSAPDIVFHKG